MAMGYGGSGAASGIGRGLNKVADMWNAHTMQQNNPYVKLMAMRQNGGAGASSLQPTAGTVGESSTPGYQQQSQKLNAAGYGRPGGPGGQSDPDGNFDPTQMSFKDLAGDPGLGLNIRDNAMTQWQQQSEPLAKAYMDAQQNYDETSTQLAEAERQADIRRQMTQQTVKKIGMGLKNPQITPEERQQLTQEMLKIQAEGESGDKNLMMLKQKAQEISQVMQEYGGQLKGMLSPEYREERPSSPYYGQEAQGQVQFGEGGDPRLYSADKAGNMQNLTPDKMGQMINNPGRRPPQYNASSYTTYGTMRK